MYTPPTPSHRPSPWLFRHLHFEPGAGWAGLPVPLFPLWEKGVCARKHHGFRWGLSHRCGFVFLWLLVPDTCFAHKSISAMLPRIIFWKVDRKAAVWTINIKDLLIVHLGRCFCLSLFLTTAYFACKRNADGLSPAAVPGLCLHLFLPGEGSFVRKHCIKRAPDVSRTQSSLDQFTPKAVRGEKL